MNTLPEIPVPAATAVLTELTKEFASALIKATAEIEGARKASVNPHFNRRYADLSAVIEAVKEPLNSHGLTFIQRIHGGQTARVETILIHESGQMLSFGIVEIPLAQAGPQGYGSALSYARRYSLSTALGVPQVDDDGEAAQQPQQQRKPAPVLPPTVKPADELPPKPGRYYYSVDTVGPDKMDSVHAWFEKSGCQWDDMARVWICDRRLIARNVSKLEIPEAEALKRCEPKEPTVSELAQEADELPEAMGGAGDVMSDEEAEQKLKQLKSKRAA